MLLSIKTDLSHSFLVYLLLQILKKPMYKNRLCFFLLFLVINKSYMLAQNRHLIDTSDLAKRGILKTDFKNIFKENRTNYTNGYKKKLKKEIIKNIDEKEDYILRLIDKKRFLFDERFTRHADSLLSLLQLKNPELADHNLKVLISKDPSPNALSLGDGFVVLNLGLFSFLQTSDQVLSVLSHEIAHDYLEHTKKGLINNAATRLNLNARNGTFKETIKKSKYKRGFTSFELLKNLIYQKGAAQRKKELQADSLGYVFYRSTSANSSDYVNALAMMDVYNSQPSIKLDSSFLKSIFFDSAKAFEEAKMQVSDFKKYNYGQYKEKLIEDSLKYHPEITERIETLNKLYGITVDEHKPNEQGSYTKLQTLARKVYLENLFQLKQHGTGIYQVLYRLALDNKENIDYYNYWLGTYFKALYEAKKTYTMNRYVDRVSPEQQNESYQLFLSLLWNLSLNDFDRYSKYYLALSQD